MLAVYYILRGLDDGDTMGDIKEAHLQLLVECEDPDELMRIGKRAFCLDSVAVEGINQRDIKAWYSELYTTVSLYEKAKDEIEECEFKSKLENIVNNVLDVYEFQTACFVVADFEVLAAFSLLIFGVPHPKISIITSKHS